MSSEATVSTHSPRTAPVEERHGGSLDERWLELVEGHNIPLNLADEFAALAARRPEALSLVVARHGEGGSGHEYDALTFGRCQELSELYARGMHEQGIRRGDTVMLLMKPILDFIPVFLALWKLGAVPVAVDSGASRALKMKFIEEIAPSALIGIPIAHGLRIAFPRSFRSIKRTVTVGATWFPGSPTLSSFLRAGKDGPFASVPTMAGDPMAIATTTGSTGPPKGVLYTHANGAAVAQGMKDALGISPEEVCLACHPAFALYFVGAGATVVIPDLDPRYPKAADPACLLAEIRDQKPTVAFMQLPVIRNLVSYCAKRGEKIPHLRKILTTGAPVPVDLVEDVHRVLAEPEADLYIMYGATEALCVAFATGRDIQAMAPRMCDGQGTYLGRPSPWVKVNIIGMTDQPIEQWSPDLVLPRGQIGEVCVQGPVVTPEYKGKPEATRKAKIHDPAGLWHRMGDAAYIDDDGGLWYCGRIADRVETEQGYLYSDLVEPIFNRHPSVNRSALVGVPRAGSVHKRPVILVEPKASASNGNSGPAQEQKLVEELTAVAREHPNTRSIEDIRIYKEDFPLDVRHNAKIRRDMLTTYATQQTEAEGTMPADRTVLFKGHRVAYYEAGQGEPVLFLHNAGNDHYIWAHQLEYFAQTCRVVGVDSLGYGKSDHPAIQYSLPLYTEMVATIVDTLALAPVTIVATCTGAAMALNFALQNPHKVKRLILFHIASEKSVLGGNLERTTKLVSGRPVMTRAITPFLETMMSRGLALRGYVRGQYGGSFKEDPAFVDHLRRLYTRNGQATSMFNLFSNWESFAGLDELTLPAGFPPVHVFWGDSNKVLPLERGCELVEKLRPQSFDVIEGGGHLVMRERPEIITRRIEELMRLPEQ